MLDIVALKNFKVMLDYICERNREYEAVGQVFIKNILSRLLREKSPRKHEGGLFIDTIKELKQQGLFKTLPELMTH